MFLVVLLDVVHELIALKNLDVGGKADSNSYSGLKASIFDVFSPLSDTFQVCIKQCSSKADKIDNRVSAFQQETGTDKNILVTLITVKPVKENAWTDTVSSFVTLQDLLV